MGVGGVCSEEKDGGRGASSTRTVKHVSGVHSDHNSRGMGGWGLEGKTQKHLTYQMQWRRTDACNNSNGQVSWVHLKSQDERGSVPVSIERLDEEERVRSGKEWKKGFGHV